MTYPFHEYTRASLKKLTGGIDVSPILPYENLSAKVRAFNENRGRISLSGAQSKFSMTIKQGEFVLTEPGETGEYILKPKLSQFENAEYGPANEHLTMDIAEQVYGIHTAAHALCFFRSGEAAYITRRYDITESGQKIQQEDFASLGGISAKTHGENYKYDAVSYEDIAALIRHHLPAFRVALLEYLKRVMFNFLFSNGDAHLKNFSVLKLPTGDYALSPAYDLINTRIHISDDLPFALSQGLFSAKEHEIVPEPPYFQAFGERIGLSPGTVRKVREMFCTDFPAAETLIRESFLSETLKEIYMRMYKYRLYVFFQSQTY